MRRGDGEDWSKCCAKVLLGGTVTIGGGKRRECTRELRIFLIKTLDKQSKLRVYKETANTNAKSTPEVVVSHTIRVWVIHLAKYL